MPVSRWRATPSPAGTRGDGNSLERRGPAGGAGQGQAAAPRVSTRPPARDPAQRHRPAGPRRAPPHHPPRPCEEQGRPSPPRTNPPQPPWRTRRLNRRRGGAPGAAAHLHQLAAARHEADLELLLPADHGGGAGEERGRGGEARRGPGLPPAPRSPPASACRCRRAGASCAPRPHWAAGTPPPQSACRRRAFIGRGAPKEEGPERGFKGAAATAALPGSALSAPAAGGRG